MTSRSLHSPPPSVIPNVTGLPQSPQGHPQTGLAEEKTLKPNQVGTVLLYGVPIVSLVIDGGERLCLAQISNTLLKDFSYNEIHNRRVALGITCVQCTPVQLEILRRAGAMPVSSRRCGMITKREAERLCKSFLGDNSPPQLPDNFAFSVGHECAWGCRGAFLPSRYNSSRAKCIRCSYCNLYFSPNKFIFHSHRLPDSKYIQPDAANFNSWRRHMRLVGDPPQHIAHAWEDVKAMFNGGTRKRMLAAHARKHSDTVRIHHSPKKESVLKPSPFLPSEIPAPISAPKIPTSSGSLLPYLDYMWGSTCPSKPFPFPPLGLSPYALPWLKRPLLPFGPPPPLLHTSTSIHFPPRESAFRPVCPPWTKKDDKKDTGSDSDSETPLDVETPDEEMADYERTKFRNSMFGLGLTLKPPNLFLSGVDMPLIMTTRDDPTTMITDSYSPPITSQLSPSDVKSSGNSSNECLTITH